MIRLENVFKFYRTRGALKIVLDHVTMNFETGFNYGILGINGAGKSTLVRLLAGGEYPNGGKITRLSRVSWPLGLASGFHPLATGRENLKFVARIYGEDIESTVNFVDDFAEIGPYLDAPVRTYSSGMAARLAFGVSMAIRFDCYLIDEVMAVGDARFQAKCRSVFENRCRNADLIMVSHQMDALREYCQRGVVVADGKLFLYDRIDDAIEMYRRLNM